MHYIAIDSTIIYRTTIILNIRNKVDDYMKVIVVKD